MKQLFAEKIKWFIAFLPLIIASVACNIVDILNVGLSAFQERCAEVSREEYVSLAESLGETPKTPQHPESAVYEACYNNSGLKSVRMSEGYKEDEEQVKSDLNPAGTYIFEGYVNDEPPPGGDDWEYQLESDFTILVADDGTVTGFRIYLLSVDDIREGCATRNEQGITTNVSGFLDGHQGYVILENKRWNFHEYHGSECGDGKDYFRDEEDVCEAIVTISGNQMDVSCEGQLLYSLIKQ